MLGKLELVLETEDKRKFSYNKAVNLQSILMSEIDADYAQKMHVSQLHPYSQNIININENNVWTINTLDIESENNIIETLCQEKFHKFKLENDNTDVTVKEKKVTLISKEDFIDKYYLNDSERYFNICFETPAAFKSQNRYIFYPDMLLIYQSIMNKFDAVPGKMKIKSDEVLEQLIDNSYITKYQLRSLNYNIGKSRISAFVGNITVKVNGPQPMVNLVNMIFHYGEYCGVGIKTGMGMGRIKLREMGDYNERRTD